MYYWDMKTITATVSHRIESVVTVLDIRTTIQPFSTGQSAFNWARKFDADQVTVFIAGRGRATSMTICKVGNHYEGR